MIKECFFHIAVPGGCVGHTHGLGEGHGLAGAAVGHGLGAGQGAGVGQDEGATHSHSFGQPFSDAHIFLHILSPSAYCVHSPLVQAPSFALPFRVTH